ncbi:MAG: BlaI/MecI/CopY family transcriptional regulator [Methylomicrobium sp.]|nr:BlaI/MecI/CopY family transcriptional regulator [Methylomicrobium sp.]
MPTNKSVIWPNREGLGKFLGDLELFLMNLIWDWPGDYPVTVKAVCAAATEQRPLAYTSVLSTMTNLVKKGLLRVEKNQFAHRYWPSSTRSEFENRMYSRLMGQLLKDLSSPHISHLVGSLETEDPELLDALYAEIQRRREHKDE